MKKLLSILAILVLFSCEEQKQQADLIVTNANIYTVDEAFSKAEAFAVKDGKFVAVGTSEAILSSYESDSIVDAKEQVITPGLIDAHCHFLNLGLGLNQVDLMGTKSYEEVVQRVVDFQKEKNLEYILGRGWDQNDWEDKSFPNKAKLDTLFPDTPIALTRVDGHAILANQAALDLGKVNIDSKIDGGELLAENDKLTGVLIDNAESLVMNYWPISTKKEAIKALLDAQDKCFGLGLTTVNDAGLSIEAINLIDSLQQSGDLKMRVYAMASATQKNLDYFIGRGIIKTDYLNVCSFKFYADGALGSRGAMLRDPYSDKPGHFGLLVNDIKTLKETAQRIANSEYQMNTHAIGDSANHAVLDTYKEVLNGKPNRRWKIEHAQIVSQEDFPKFNDIIPSVQPTHATSDMYWAEDRVGAERIKGAYAFKDLLNQYGKVALGTDFPVERVNPMLTFYAAVARQDLEQYPDGGFQMENALSREEALRGMTIWAAYSNFEDHEKGSIEVGKFADFIILDKDIVTVEAVDIPNTKVVETYVGGEKQ
ncbi:amidohydrolase [Winogradskyella haliclonae]|uniref:Amidohydrolase n=1 Tax=Winogradskyella haliclonae TaxID=2048558 RepID=A0ABQ2BX46_9FLAO|nr:amidohydrolase [Winogradskyella haliclonae]GGI57036.1 amidohydrolase [Winogradskyella haliclonae]